MKKLFSIIALLFLTIQLIAQQAPNDKVIHLRGNNGSTYTFTTTGTNEGSVWGGADGIFTDDSRLGAAAVHAGLLRIGETGKVSVKILSGRNNYRGSSRNGITTKDYGVWSGSFQFGASQNVAPAVGNAPENMTEYRGNNGSTYTFTITGTTDGNIWGGADGYYTDDTKLSTAVVHAGILRAGETGTINVTIQPGQNSYKGSTQNGISSKDYAAWQGSYTFGKAVQVNIDPVLNAPNSMADYRANTGKVYTFRVQGSNQGTVWGGADGLYTDDSKLGVAAVHAGLVRVGEEAILKVRIVRGQASYKGSSKNGISSKDYGAWSGSFKFE